MRTLIITLGLLTACSLRAQDSTSIEIPIDPGTQVMIESNATNSVLLSGPGFTVKKEELATEIDEKVGYLSVAPQGCNIVLTNGEQRVLPTRIQLVDQQLEVTQGDRLAVVDRRMVREVICPGDRRFVPYDRLLPSGTALPLLEVLFEGETGDLLAHRNAEWREPSQQKTSYDRGNYARRLRRVDTIYLRVSGKMAEIKNMKALVRSLPDPTAAAAIAKREKLKNNEQDYVRLLTELR